MFSVSGLLGLGVLYSTLLLWLRIPRKYILFFSRGGLRASVSFRIWRGCLRQGVSQEWGTPSMPPNADPKP